MKDFNFATEKHESRSDKYVVIDTNHVVSLLQARGFEVEEVVRGRRGVSHKFGHHIVNLVNPALPEIEGEGRFRVVISNSYDGSTRFSIGAGFYRLVCENGLMLGTGVLRTVGKHIHVDAEEVYRRLDEVIANLPLLSEKINKAKETDFNALNVGKIDESIRFFMNERLRLKEEDEVDMSSLFEYRREKDNKSDLWTMLNVLQENLLRGTAVEVNGKRVKMRNVERSPKQYAKVNKLISELLEAV
jgi:hypothetical protein